LELVALDDLVVGHLFTGLLGDAAVSDAASGRRLELVEAHVARLRGGHEAHGHRHQPEADRTRPDGLRHGMSPVVVAPTMVDSASPSRSPSTAPLLSYYLRRSWPLLPRGAPGRAPSRQPTSRWRAGACA